MSVMLHWGRFVVLSLALPAVHPGPMWALPEPGCWLHPEVEVRRSAIEGDGLVARSPLAAGTAVSRLGGRLVTGDDLLRLLAVSTHYVDSITVARDTHLVLPPGQPNGKGNHSCDPNLWWATPYTLVARRDVAAGEELTNDYATSTDEPSFVMPCRCGTRLCRREVTGADWTRLELQERYGDHWVPALLDRIRQSSR
ncbi:SET domain-containing protein [Actinoplanes awajinensis]|nr:SET domain-containing protein [Actinoplanes awajinensis]